MTDMIKCRCSLCNGGYALPPERVGKVMECPHCHEKARFSPRSQEAPPTIPAPPAALGGEQTFFNESGIAVTRTRFVAGVQTFAMSGITSVRIAEIAPGMGGGLLVMLLGGGALLLALGTWMDSIIAALVFVAIGAACIIAGVKMESAKKKSYVVVLSTSGGEVKAYTSYDLEFVARLTGALNNAIISRG